MIFVFFTQYQKCITVKTGVPRTIVLLCWQFLSGFSFEQMLSIMFFETDSNRVRLMRSSKETTFQILHENRVCFKYLMQLYYYNNI